MGRRRRGYAEDYAYLIFGLLELFQADGDPAVAGVGADAAARQDELFWDPIDGGWFSTTGKDASVLLRLKEDYDGAEPAASSVSVLNLLTLSHLTRELTPEKIEQHARRTLLRVSAQSGRAVPMMLAALSTYHAGMPQVVIVGDASARRHASAARCRPPALPADGDRRAASTPTSTTKRLDRCCRGQRA